MISRHKDSVEVGLLIGLNCPGALWPRDVICRNENDPYAVRSLLGWYVNGPVSNNSSKQVNCNQIQILKTSIDDGAQGYIVGERMTRERITPQVVSRMFERKNGVALFRDDRQFLKVVEEGILHRDDMHYEIPLPFREGNVQLPNNRSQAVQRLHSLKKRLQGDRQYRAEYVSFISEIIEKGYARKVSAEELPPEEGKVWYLPHHGVYHPKKPNSLRIVFDCSARYQGELLNDHLLQQLDLSSELTGVLTRFRKERVAFMVDKSKSR